MVVLLVLVELINVIFCFGFVNIDIFFKINLLLLYLKFMWFNFILFFNLVNLFLLFYV